MLKIIIKPSNILGAFFLLILIFIGNDAHGEFWGLAQQTSQGQRMKIVTHTQTTPADIQQVERINKKEKPYIEYPSLDGSPKEGWERAPISELEVLAQSVSSDPEEQKQFLEDAKNLNLEKRYLLRDQSKLDAPPAGLNHPENPEEVYPIIFVHGITNQPSDMQPLIDRIAWNYEQPFSEIYAEDAEALQGTYPINTIWNVGYYKNRASFPGQYEYQGRISPFPIGDPQYDNRVSYAIQFQRVVENILRVTGAPKVNIVAYSMGGLVARTYIKFLDGESKIHKLLMYGTPNHGTASSDSVFGFCKGGGFQDWMDDGEISEMIGSVDYFPPLCPYRFITNAWNGKSFPDFLNEGDESWGVVRYGTIAGTRKLWYGLGPEDGVVNVSSVHLEGAEFNAKFYGSHFAGGDPGVPSEFSITQSTFTAESIRQWVGYSDFAVQPQFERIAGYAFLYVPNPHDQAPVIYSNIQSGDAVSFQILIFNILGEPVYYNGLPLSAGDHEPRVDLSAIGGNGVYISYIRAYDQYGELFLEKFKVAKICCTGDDPPIEPTTIIDEAPPMRSESSSAMVKFHPSDGNSESRWSIDGATWTPWTTAQEVSLQNLTSGFHNVEIASRYQGMGWLDQTTTTAAWYKSRVVDPADHLTIRDVNYDRGGRLLLTWSLSQDDATKVTSYEILRQDQSDAEPLSMGHVPPGTTQFIDETAGEGEGAYIIRTHSEQGFEETDPVIAPPAESNIERELVMTHVRPQTFRYQLINAAPLTSYELISYHYTYDPVEQSRITIETDLFGDAEGEIFSRDEAIGGSYTYAVATSLNPLDPHSLRSNDIVNARQVDETLTVNPLPDVVEDPNVILSGSKNIGSSVWLNDVEIIPLNWDSTWSFPIVVDPGESALTIKTKNDYNEINGVRIVTINHQHQLVKVFDTPYDNGGALSIAWAISFPNLTKFEIHRRILPSGSTTLLASRPPETQSYVDRFVDPDLSYEYTVRAHTPTQSFDYFGTSVTPVDNIPRELLLTRLSSETFEYLLVDAEANTPYTITSYHHTDIDYSQDTEYVTTDEHGYAKGELYSRDYTWGSSYVYAKATRPQETMVSNRITNARQVESAFRIDPFPEVTREQGLTITGTKNAHTSLWVNGKEVMPLSEETQWSLAVTLDEGDNALTIVTKNSSAEINGAGIADIYYLTGPVGTPTVDPVTSPTRETSQILHGTKLEGTSLWINDEMKTPRDLETTWEVEVNLENGSNVFRIDMRDGWERPSFPVIAVILMDNIPPSPPTVDPIDQPVNDTWVVIQGNKDPGSSVLVNGEEHVPMSMESRYVTVLDLLQEGANLFIITSQDEVGNESSPVSLTVIRDRKPPPDVSNFTGSWDGQYTHLSWTNPTDPSFDHVTLTKMLRNPRAMYIWDEDGIVDALINDRGSARNDLFAFADAPHGLNEKPIRTLYLQAVTATTNHVRDNSENLQNFIADATEHRIRVVYLDGDPTWATTNHDLAQERLEDMIAYNAGSLPKERFSGVQYDVEPYLLPGWYSDAIWGVYIPGQTYDGYLGMLGKSQETVDQSGQNIFFSADMPFWYDDGVVNHPNLHEQVMDIVDEVIIMDYRDSAWGSGHGGGIQLIENEFAYAQLIGKPVTVAVETQDIEPDYITFFEEGVSRMEDEMGLIFASYGASPSFHEFALHYYNTYQTLPWWGTSPHVWDVLGTEGDGLDDNADKLVGVRSSLYSQYFIQSMVHALPKESLTVWQLNVGIDSTMGTDPKIPVDIYIGESAGPHDITNPILVKVGWVPEWKVSWQSIVLDAPYVMEADQSYGIWFKTRTVNNVIGSHYLRLSSDESANDIRFSVMTDEWYDHDWYGAIQLVDTRAKTFTHTPRDRWFTEIYSGADETFIDTTVVSPSSTFYRIFSRDEVGNASKGKILEVNASEK
jgi:pimeloyl-ACP methyl ester carboxylesterase